MTIKVIGISSKGTKTVHKYVGYSELNSIENIRKAIEWADREYNVEYDPITYKPISNTEYKEFEKITNIEILEY